MSSYFTIEDADNIRTIVTHHCGVPQTDAERTVYNALMSDLLRYCTRLRNQPNTHAHTDHHGYRVPPHQLIEATG